jgi:hypothetical protein
LFFGVDAFCSSLPSEADSLDDGVDSNRVLDDLDWEAVLVGLGMQLLDNGLHAAVRDGRLHFRVCRRLSRRIVR